MRQTPPWQGIHHLALATPDLDATIAFYCGVLGMRLALTRRGPDGTPHCFIDAGGGMALHFWQAGVEIFTQPPLSRGFIPGALQHLSFRLPDEAALVALHDRLRGAGRDVSDVFDQGPVRLCFFQDPHGIQLEAAYWRADLLHGPFAAADLERYADPAPGPATREAMRAAAAGNETRDNHDSADSQADTD